MQSGFFDSLRHRKQIVFDAFSFTYDGWCSHVGDMYAMGLGNFKAEYRTGTTDQRLYDLSNLLSCEAHHELLNNYLRNLMEHRWEAVKAGIEPVLELSRLPVSMF